MKNHIVFFLKRCHCIAVLHIGNMWFATNDNLPAPMCCSKTVKSCVLRMIDMAGKGSHSDRSLKLKKKRRSVSRAIDRSKKSYRNVGGI